MGINPVGLVAALSAFAGVWFGHVAVRRIESISPSLRPPAALFIGLGLALELASTRTRSLPLSAACGILGITFLWDALELVRQERRICHGHAPANPLNPRHTRILAEYPAATRVDLLKREPLGRPAASPETSGLASPRS